MSNAQLVRVCRAGTRVGVLVSYLVSFSIKHFHHPNLLYHLSEKWMRTQMIFRRFIQPIYNHE